MVELLVVIAIIGILSTVVVVGARNVLKKARIVKAQQTIDQIQKAIDALVLDILEWPGHQAIDQASAPSNNEICGPDANIPSVTCDTGLSSDSSGIVNNDSLEPYIGWLGPYMNSIALDP